MSPSWHIQPHHISWIGGVTYVVSTCHLRDHYLTHASGHIWPLATHGSCFASVIWTPVKHSLQSYGQKNFHSASAMRMNLYLHVCRLYTKDFFYPVISVFTALLVAPRFRKSLQSASVYEFLETRFGLECRLFGAATYVVSQLLKLCTTLYLMAVPISMLLNAPLPLVIIFTGAFVTCYSMAGGISAVVYTDVLQVSCFAIMHGTIQIHSVGSCMLHICQRWPSYAGECNVQSTDQHCSHRTLTITADPPACTVSSTHTYLFAICYADWLCKLHIPPFHAYIGCHCILKQGQCSRKISTASQLCCLTEACKLSPFSCPSCRLSFS